MDCSKPDALQLEQVRAALAQAERDIAEGEIRILEQRLQFEALWAGRHDTTEAERMLGHLLDTLAARNAERDEILRLIRTLLNS